MGWVMVQEPLKRQGAVIGIIGRSGSGKTTLLEFLVSKLASRGKRVNVIKHSHHDVTLEPPHKDSARLRTAGAAEVMVSSPYRFAIVHELRGQPEPTLEQQLARLAPADLTLVEGFKFSPIPKIEVYRWRVEEDSPAEPPLYLSDENVIAVASNLPRPDDLSDYVLWLNLDQPDQVLDLLEACFV
jgi:molybdopterin-guanine dinucleotide biosynthesis protein B